VASACEHSSEPLGSIKGRIFLDQLSNYQLLMEDSVSCVKSVMRLALKRVKLKAFNSKVIAVMLYLYKIS
jgi:hypothetical protein